MSRSVALEACAAGRTYQEIAEQLGISHGTVRMSISRERARLRERSSAADKLEELRQQVLGRARTAEVRPRG